MKITAVETIQLREYPNLLWVELHTDEGIVGLGETFRGADAVAGQVHGLVAPYLLGRDPLQIELHSNALINGVLGSPAPVRNCGRPRQWTSHCGIFSARRWGSRSISCSAG